LAQTFTVITLGGPHLGGVATLEDRARAPTYQAMFRTLIDLMAPAPGERSSTSVAAPDRSIGCWRDGWELPTRSPRSTPTPSC